jgi:hypothetical protein
LDAELALEAPSLPGRIVGIVINYSPYQAFRFDGNGHPIEILARLSVRLPLF